MRTSWIIRSRETGEAVLETFNPRVTALINTDKYEVLTAQEHLARLNREIKESTNVQD